MGFPQGWELVLVLLVVLLLFGAKRLPDTARGLGRSLRIFKAETKGLRGEEDGDVRADRLEGERPVRDGQVIRAREVGDERVVRRTGSTDASTAASPAASAPSTTGADGVVRETRVIETRADVRPLGAEQRDLRDLPER